MFRPDACVISPSRRACAAVTMPLAIRMRIMKWPGVGDAPPPLAGEAHEVFGDVEAVTLGLERFDLVHVIDPKPLNNSAIPVASATRRRRTAQAFSSGWCDTGSRPLSVRLLALL